MTAHCTSYDTVAEAEKAAAGLAGSGAHVRLLMGAALHDARREDRGRFAGAVAPHEHVGAFAGAGPERAAPRGGFAGAPGGQEGTFGNADRDVVVTRHDGAEQTHVAGHAELKALLVEAGLDEATAESDLGALHAGRVLVLATL